MLKYLILVICVQLIKAQYGRNYRAAPENYHTFSSNDNIPYHRPLGESANTKREMDLDFDDFDHDDENFNNGVEPKSIDTLIEEVQDIMSEMKVKLSNQFREITSLDQQNQEKAKKNLAEMRTEIENRVEYIEQFVYKKREDGAHVNMMQCVSDSLNKLSRVTPELMKDGERCISSELETSRAGTKATLDMLKDNLQKIKLHQERLNKCNSMYKRKKGCLISVFNEMAKFKKTVMASMSPKLTETVAFITGSPGRLRDCTTGMISRVMSRASDIITRFNTCMKSISAEAKKKKNNDMLLFVV